MNTRYTTLTQVTYETGITHDRYIQLNHTDTDGLVQIVVMDAQYDRVYAFEINASTDANNLAEMFAEIARQQITYEEGQ